MRERRVVPVAPESLRSDVARLNRLLGEGWGFAEGLPAMIAELGQARLFFLERITKDPPPGVTSGPVYAGS